MHTIRTGVVTFHYNSDLSGEVEVVDNRDGTKIEVPGEDLLHFAAEIVRRNRIQAIELQSDNDTLGIKVNA